MVYPVFCATPDEIEFVKPNDVIHLTYNRRSVGHGRFPERADAGGGTDATRLSSATH
ncbi:protein of unknown function [Paraburkholderia dioscoreae]|uniref:Uncharacterized protein n=1 Tax=Paraburkholderia dioscoreae TaxID=2604047 RepID=A0A5Q4Z3L4_9BURK|nr:protein of unknown function [Paraburkholderia dioscoreae]